MARTLKKPKYGLHRPTNQARVRIDGTDHYLGEYGSQASKDKYDDLMLEWLTQNVDSFKVSLRVDDLCVLFMDHAEKYYRHRDKTPTGETDSLRHALKFLIAKHGTIPAQKFGPLKLIAVQDAMIKAGLVRTNINRQIHRIKRVFRWAVSRQLIPIATYQALQTVPALAQGRSDAAESKPVKPVPLDVVKQTIPFLSQVLADMVRLQLLTGARPGEIRTLRPCDVDLSLSVWVYSPEKHKTQHRGHKRKIFIGPDGQRVLERYLRRDPNAYCFSPADAFEERQASRKASRKSPMTPSQAARKSRQPRTREFYSKDGYNRAITRACETAFKMPEHLRESALRVTLGETAELLRAAAQWREENCWSPGQLRHTRATEIRKLYGRDAARVILGHSDDETVDVYAEEDFEKAAEIMSKIG